jgi:hypothetical protein
MFMPPITHDRAMATAPQVRRSKSKKIKSLQEPIRADNVECEVPGLDLFCARQLFAWRRAPLQILEHSMNRSQDCRVGQCTCGRKFDHCTLHYLETGKPCWRERIRSRLPRRVGVPTARSRAG